MKRKLSILMPTFNDAETIVESLDSVRLQSNPHWELIIINDGSDDDTVEIVNDYIHKHNLKSKIRLISQTNQDQLRAIKHGAKYASGEIVTTLHSDDLLYDQDVVDKILNYDFETAEAIFCDLLTIDENSNDLKMQSFNGFNPSEELLVETLLMYGRQQFSDSFIAQKAFFDKMIIDSYLSWNMPFYISTESDTEPIANIKKANFIDRRYRIHGANYANSELGQLNVINGELRTAVRLMRIFNIPCYSLQAFVFRACKKIGLKYKIFYQKNKTASPEKVIKTILNMRFRSTYWQSNDLLRSIYAFYKNRTKRQITVSIPKNEFIYLGCDIRRFNKELLADKLSEFYQNFLSEMRQGFSEIACTSADFEKVTQLSKFLCIDGFVKIKVKNAHSKLD